jgi:tetrahydromethanopterin S-methyltransferase subunit A
MNKIAIAGRLVSENNGIDKIIKYYLTNNHELTHLTVCGKDGHGHRAGHSLISLSDRGVTKNGKIILSKSPYPDLESSYEDVQTFRDRITIHNLMEETNLNSRDYIDRLV